MAVTGLRIRKIKPGGAAVIGLFFLFAVFSWNKTTGYLFRCSFSPCGGYAERQTFGSREPKLTRFRQLGEKDRAIGG